MLTDDGDGTIALVDELIGVVAVDMGSVLFGMVATVDVVVGTWASFNSKSSTSRLLCFVGK